jgi:hypothetical protein
MDYVDQLDEICLKCFIKLADNHKSSLINVFWKMYHLKSIGDHGSTSSIAEEFHFPSTIDPDLSNQSSDNKDYMSGLSTESDIKGKKYCHSSDDVIKILALHDIADILNQIGSVFVHDGENYYFVLDGYIMNYSRFHSFLTSELCAIHFDDWFILYNDCFLDKYFPWEVI